GLAARGLVSRLRAAVGRPEPREALDGLIAAFGGFWNSDRIVIRRIRGLSLIDVDFDRAVRARDERRREAIRTILAGCGGKYNQPPPRALHEMTHLLHTLTSFYTFHNLPLTPPTPA